MRRSCACLLPMTCTIRRSQVKLAFAWSILGLGLAVVTWFGAMIDPGLVKHGTLLAVLPLAIGYDNSVPVLLFKVSRYPFSHGSLGAIRSLGRVGVPIHAVIEDRFVPYALSRYLTSPIHLSPQLAERPAELVSKLKGIAERMGIRPILLPTDDEAALLTASHAATLRSHFITSEAGAELVSTLASKAGLYRLCMQHGVPTPATAFAKTRSEVVSLSETMRFPIVVKNSDPWIRLSQPAVRATTPVASREELLAMASSWPAAAHVILQEYIPDEAAEDWIFHAYCDRSSRALVAFTGLKQRSWPPRAGVTTAAIALPNDALSARATTFLKAIGYQGIVDTDWRFDARDGEFKLLDFNPRPGANFRLFTTEKDIDVIRAMHLDMTGRDVPAASPVSGRRLIVENLDLASRLFGRANAPAATKHRHSSTETAWFASDDPLPFFAMGVRFSGVAIRHLATAALRPLLRPATATQSRTSKSGGL